MHIESILNIENSGIRNTHHLLFPLISSQITEIVSWILPTVMGLASCSASQSRPIHDVRGTIVDDPVNTFTAKMVVSKFSPE
jgi:hypothetical protein